MAWNLRGAMALGEYLELSAFDRESVSTALEQQIEEHNHRLDDDGWLPT